MAVWVSGVGCVCRRQRTSHGYKGDLFLLFLRLAHWVAHTARTAHQGVNAQHVCPREGAHAHGPSATCCTPSTLHNHHHYTTTQDGQAIKPSERIAANQALPDLERALREELEAEGVDIQVRWWVGQRVY